MVEIGLQPARYAKGRAQEAEPPQLPPTCCGQRVDRYALPRLVLRVLGDEVRLEAGCAQRRQLPVQNAWVQRVVHRGDVRDARPAFSSAHIHFPLANPRAARLVGRCEVSSRFVFPSSKLSMRAPPLVSVVLPTYNRARLLRRAAGSVLAQTHRNFELLVVDDASTNDTHALVEALDDDRIRFLQHAENQGGSAARNTGLHAARGRYVAFLDSDDEWLPQKLARQIAVFRARPDVDAVCTADIVYRNGAPQGVRFAKPVAKGQMLPTLLRRYVGTSSSLIVRRHCLRAVGGFDEALPSCQDWGPLHPTGGSFFHRAPPRPARALPLR